MDDAPKLTCARCKAKKIKCDKAAPCAPCKAAGIRCDVVQRARLPRGRSGKGRVAKTTMMESRVAKIENLLKQAQAASPEAGSLPLETTGEPVAELEQPNKTKDFLAPNFWFALSEEVAGLRDTFDGSDEEDFVLDEQSFIPPQVSLDSISSNNALFPPSDLHSRGKPLPSHSERVQMLNLYQSRVHVLYNVLHWPSVIAKIEAYYEDPSSANYTQSDIALEYSIYLMSVATTTDEECERIFLCNRMHLCQRYRAAAEAALAEANLILAPDLTVLQAFLIYLLALRTLLSCTATWTLLAVATRIGSSIGLGFENPKKYSRLELEVRRRVWFCIGALDTFASFDRGTLPLLHSTDFGEPPLNINDIDLSKGNLQDVSEEAFTDMSFSLLLSAGMLCHKRVLDVPTGTPSSWNRKLEIISDLEKFVNQRYGAINTSSPPLQQLAKFCGTEMVASQHLILRRPPYRNHRTQVPMWDDFDVLRVATDVIERAFPIKRPTGRCEMSPWSWRSWAQWHALAVALAELCNNPTGPGSDRAYDVACECARLYAIQVTDTESDIMWEPLSKLVHKATLARQLAQKSTGNTQHAQQAPEVFDSPFANSEPESVSSVGSQQQSVNQDALRSQDWAVKYETSNALTRLEIQPTGKMTGFMGPIGAADFMDWDMFIVDMSEVANAQR